MYEAPLLKGLENVPALCVPGSIELGTLPIYLSLTHSLNESTTALARLYNVLAGLLLHPLYDVKCISATFCD